MSRESIRGSQDLGIRNRWRETYIILYGRKWKGAKASRSQAGEGGGPRCRSPADYGWRSFTYAGNYCLSATGVSSMVVWSGFSGEGLKTPCFGGAYIILYRIGSLADYERIKVCKILLSKT